MKTLNLKSNESLKLGKSGINITLNGTPVITNNGRIENILRSELIFTTKSDIVIEDIDLFLENLLKSSEYAELLATHRAKRADRQSENEANSQKVQLTMQNIEAASIEDIYHVVVYLSNIGNSGWEACRILTGDNALAKHLVSKLGSFTATPYDDGNIYLKGA